MDINVEVIKKLPTKQKAIALVVILVLIAGLYWYLAYNPKAVELAGLVASSEKLQAELTESQALAADLPRFKEEVVKLNEQLKKALIELPDKKEIPSLLTNISNLGTESGLEFLSFKPMPEAPAGFYARVPVALNVKGSFYEVATFFDKVGKLPRIVNISDVTTGGAKLEGGKLVLTTSCLATTYRFIEGESVKK